MSTDTLSTLFALLALACAVATVVVIVLLIAARWAGAGSAIHAVRTAVGDLSLWLAWLVATVTTLGSLYYSLVADYLPCELCWYQRICMYPLSAILLVGALRRDRKVWMYAAVPAVVGTIIATYHTQLQAFPKQRTFCDMDNPCTNRFVWEFGFVSLPLMDLIAFCFVITMVVAWSTNGHAANGPNTEPPLLEKMESA